MLCEAFVLAWDEEDYIALTIKHYQQFCDKITVFDNYSDDRTSQIAQDMGCQVIKFGTPGVLDDTEYLKVKNNCWKESKAKWVIVVDRDEILWHRDMIGLLEKETCTIIPSWGFSVTSNNKPQNNYLEITDGVPDSSYSKYALFSPKLKGINYVYGCHVARPQGDVEIGDNHVILLHYRNVGGVESIIKRHEQYRQRLSPKNKRFGLGRHYEFEDTKRIKDWNDDYKSRISLDTFIRNRMV